MLRLLYNYVLWFRALIGRPSGQFNESFNGFALMGEDNIIFGRFIIDKISICRHINIFRVYKLNKGNIILTEYSISTDEYYYPSIGKRILFELLETVYCRDLTQTVMLSCRAGVSTMYGLPSFTPRDKYNNSVSWRYDEDNDVNIITGVEQDTLDTYIRGQLAEDGDEMLRKLSDRIEGQLWTHS